MILHNVSGWNQQGQLFSHTQGDSRSGAGMSGELVTCCSKQHKCEREDNQARHRGREEERDCGIFLFDSKQWRDFIHSVTGTVVMDLVS